MSATQWLNVTVYLPAPLAARLRAERARSKQSYAVLLSRAFEAIEPSVLHERWSRDDRPATGSGMPPGPGWDRPKGAKQVQLRITPEQRQWLDAQVQRFEAPSRSALIGTVFDIGLP